MAGVESTGFVRPGTNDLLDEMKAAIKASSQFGASTNVEADSWIGQILAIIADRLSAAWQLGEAIYNALYPDTAEGAALDNVCELVGVSRLAATRSTVDVTLTGTPSTVISAGARLSVVGSAEKFQLVANATIGGGGSVVAEFESIETGPVRANAGTLTQIETVVTGWTGANNATDATLGRDIETDAELRLRRLLALRVTGAGTVESIAAYLLQEVADVTDVKVIENDADTTDSESRPPHSIHCIVDGGTDEDVATAIFLKKPAGIATHGDETVTVEDSMGFDHDINFDRSEAVPIFIHLILTVDADEFNVGQAQSVRVSVDTVADDTDYTVTIQGVEFTIDSGTGATDLSIAAALVSAISGGTGATHVYVTPTDNSDGTFDLDAEFDGNEFTVTVDANMSTETLIENDGDQSTIVQAVADYADEKQTIGVDFILSRYFVPANSVGGVLSIVIKADTSEDPTATANIDMTSKQRASVDVRTVSVDVVVA